MIYLIVINQFQLYSSLWKSKAQQKKVGVQTNNIKKIKYNY